MAATGITRWPFVFFFCGGNASTSIKRYRKETKKEEEKKNKRTKKKIPKWTTGKWLWVEIQFGGGHGDSFTALVSTISLGP